MFFDRIGSISWRVRRRIVVLTLVYCGAYVGYLGVWGRDITLSETIANGLILLAGSVIGSYVFGVVWDDKNRIDTAQTTIESKVTTQTPPADPQPPDGFAS